MQLIFGKMALKCKMAMEILLIIAIISSQDFITFLKTIYNCPCPSSILFHKH